MDVRGSRINGASTIYPQDRLTLSRQPGNVRANIDHEILHPSGANYHLILCSMHSNFGARHKGTLKAPESARECLPQFLNLERGWVRFSMATSLMPLVGG